MWARFLYYILQFKGLVGLTLSTMLVVTLIILILMRDFSWNRRRHLLVVTLFFGLPVRYMVYLAANYIQLMFVLSMLATRADVQLSHLVLLLLLGIIQAVAIAQPVESIRSFIGSAMLYIAFLIVDLLESYIFEMRFDWRIAFVWVLLCVFLVLYSVYFFINSMKCLASRGIEQKKLLWEKTVQYKPKDPGEEAGLIDLDTVELEDVPSPGEEKEL